MANQPTLAIDPTDAAQACSDGLARSRASERAAGCHTPDWVSGLRRWLTNCRARRELRRCVSLDPRFVADVGLTESEIVRACNVPFWVSVARASERPAAIAITSIGEEGQLLRRLGVDDIILYETTRDWPRAVREMTSGDGVDHVVETGSIEPLPKSLAACA